MDLDAEPDDPRYPPGCLDESPVPLTRETRGPLPPRPGPPARYDSEYKREGTAHLFLFGQPLQGWRQVNVTLRRTKQDFAEHLRWRVDQYFPAAERLRRVMDHLNTPTPAALSGVFPPAEARRIIRQLEFHYTPQQGSGLNRAECEFAVLAGPCLDRRIPNIETLPKEIAAWPPPRNPHQANINGQFDTPWARVKLKRLYPLYVWSLVEYPETW